jgi:hypothetical protein
MVMAVTKAMGFVLTVMMIMLVRKTVMVSETHMVLTSLSQSIAKHGKL